MKYLKNNRWVLALIIILILITGFIVVDSRNQKESNSSTSEINYNRLDNISYAVGKDFVEFYYFLDKPEEIRNNFAYISKTNSPKLFQGVDELHEIVIKPFYSSNKLFYILENVYPDHGTIVSDFSIVIDPFDGATDYHMAKILYESNDIFNSGSGSKIWATKEGDIQVSTIYQQVYLDGGGRTDGYVFIDFLSYNKAQNKFVLENTKHKDDISKYFEEAKKTGKEEVISDKEYTDILNTYQNIINGKEESMFNKS